MQYNLLHAMTPCVIHTTSLQMTTLASSYHLKPEFLPKIIIPTTFRCIELNYIVVYTSYNLKTSNSVVQSVVLTMKSSSAACAP